MAEPRITQLNPVRQPPNSMEAEQSLLGALMLSEHAWDKIADRITEGDFYRETHRLIFRAIGELQAAHQPGDAVTVADWFARNDLLDRVEGGAYVTMLANETPGTTNVLGYAEIVREKSILRQLIEIGTEVSDSALNPSGISSKELLEAAEQKMYAIAEQGMRSGNSYQHVKDVMSRALDRLNELQDNTGDITGVTSGFVELDKRTAGLQPTDLIIVAGRPAMGKCLSHDAEVVLDDGTVATMADIYRERPGRVGTLNRDFRLDRAMPERYVDDGEKPVFEVTTGLGRRVRTTLTHPFLTLDGWKPLGEIAEGDFVAVPRRLPVFGHKRMRDCEIRLLGYLIGDGGLTGPTPMFTATNPEIQRDFAECVGKFGGLSLRTIKDRERAQSFAVTGDRVGVSDARAAFAQNLNRAIGQGGMTARALASAVGVAPATVTYWRQGRNVPDDERCRRLGELLGIEVETLFDETPESARRNRPNPLRVWLEELGLYSHDAHGKFVPAPVFQLEADQIGAFLNRLFATDGWASVYASGQAQIGYASVSERLVRQVQHLLLRFDILARVRPRTTQYQNGSRPSWSLQITHADSLRTFCKRIGIHGKQAEIEAVMAALEKKAPHCNADLIPVEIWNVIEREKGDMSWAELARRAGMGSNPHPHRQRVSRLRLRRFALALQSRELMSLAENDVYWDRIERIEAIGNRQVYDLTIPDTHNFIANDVCVHNTSFAMNIAASAAIKAKVPVAVFSMEMSDLQLVLRACSLHGGESTRTSSGPANWTRPITRTCSRR